MYHLMIDQGPLAGVDSPVPIDRLWDRPHLNLVGRWSARYAMLDIVLGQLA